MCRYLWVLVLGIFYINSVHADTVEKKFSLGLHGFESLLGNYGLTAAVKLSSHVELTIPVEFYSFAYSLPGSLALKVARDMAQSNGFNNSLGLSMFHLRAGLGTRIFFTPSAMSSGWYFQPIVYAGWIRTSNFSGVEFDDQAEVLNSVITALYRELPKTDRFAVTPQLNLGYQWMGDSGLFFQLAAYGNYVYAPSIDSIFNAADRLFASNAVNSSIRSAMPSTAVELYRALGTQMNGWHAGLMMNFGMAF